MLYFGVGLIAAIVLALLFGYRARELPFYVVLMRVVTLVFLTAAVTWDDHTLPWTLLIPLAYLLARTYAVDRQVGGAVEKSKCKLLA